MTPIRVSRYNPSAFVLIGSPSPVPIFRVQIVDTETVTRGYVVWHSSGEASTASYTLFDALAIGICQSTVDNTDDGLYAEVIPFYQHLRWQVASGDELLNQANVGTIVDLTNQYSIDPSDTSPVYVGFRIEEIDISTAAKAASSTFGFAIGHFETMGAT